jgi:uncharacterized repeat protein (TIGR03847 family)
MSIDIGMVLTIGADAVGRPGQRRFRMYVRNTRASAVMWMEKEHLNSLSLALDQFLALATSGEVLRTEARAGAPSSSIQSMPPDFPLSPTYEFQVGQIKLNYDEREETFVLNVTPMEIILEPGQDPLIEMREDDSIQFAFTQQDAQNLSQAITQVVSAGRPVCPLCGAPLNDGPHSCVKQNGHREIIQIEEDDDDEDE